MIKKCKYCKREVNPAKYITSRITEIMEEQQVCFQHAFWLERAEKDACLKTKKGFKPIIAEDIKGNRIHYLVMRVDPLKIINRGFGGTSVYARALGKTRFYKYNNVWCQGLIPRKFWDLFPVTHELKWNK